MKTTLLLIDIQNDYFEGGKMELVGAEKACINAGLLLDKFRTENLPVIHIQHIANRAGATFFLPGTKGIEIHQKVRPKDDEKQILKYYPNSFKETELLDYLENLEITDLVICGMMTHMCVDATTRAAKDFGFNCTLVGDACATKDLEFDGQIVKAKDVHFSFLAALNYVYANVLSTKEFLEE